MPGNAMGRRQPERNLAPFQATYRVDVDRTPEMKKRIRKVQLFAHLSRLERKSHLQHMD